VKDTLNKLVQIQELEYVVLEQEGFADAGRLAYLEESIRDLLAELPDDAARLYLRLKDRGAPVVVAELDGLCSACSMRVPSSQLASIRSSTSLQRCQTCSRILYHPSVVSRRPKEELAGPRSGIARFSSPSLMCPSLEASTPREVITELAQLMAEVDLIDKPEELAESALRREALASTALGSGLAIPHVRGVEGGGLAFALGLKKEGFVFDPSADEPTQIVFFFVVPAAASNSFLELLAGLVGAFRTKAARKKLLVSDTPEKLFERLAKLTEETFR